MLFRKLVFIGVILMFRPIQTRAQQPDSVSLPQLQLQEIHVDKDYDRKYQTALRRVRKVYPLALYAAEELKKLDEELSGAESRRKQKKITREANQELHEDFQFVIRSLSIQEGNMLTKLISRETGMTVSEIIKKYRGGLRAGLQENLGKIWDQNFDAKYDPDGEDWITEQVIRDIQAKKVYFDPTVKKMDRSQYHESQKKYRINKRAARKTMRAKRKAGSE